MAIGSVRIIGIVLLSHSFPRLPWLSVSFHHIFGCWLRVGQVHVSSFSTSLKVDKSNLQMTKERSLPLFMYNTLGAAAVAEEHGNLGQSNFTNQLFANIVVALLSCCFCFIIVHNIVVARKFIYRWPHNLRRRR